MDLIFILASQKFALNARGRRIANSVYIYSGLCPYGW